MVDPLKIPDSPIHIENNDSRVHRFFQIDSPFQLTLETCSGSGADGYVNTVTLSPEKANLYQKRTSEKNWFWENGVPHFHDFYEFLIVLDGSLTQQIEGNDYLYSAGTCCLINRGLCHLERYTDFCRVLFLGISPDFLWELFDDEKMKSTSDKPSIFTSEMYRFLDDDRKNPGKKLYLDFLPCGGGKIPTRRVHDIAEQLLRTLLGDDFGGEYLARGLICALLDCLASPKNYSCTDIRLDESKDFLLFSRASRLLEENDGRISRAALTELLGYSGGYINRVVRKYTGLCLYDYGMDFCMKKAAAELAESNDTISAIAARLKFTNRTHFYQVFQKKYGLTPREYRKSKQADSLVQN